MKFCGNAITEDYIYNNIKSFIKAAEINSALTTKELKISCINELFKSIETNNVVVSHIIVPLSVKDQLKLFYNNNSNCPLIHQDILSFKYKIWTAEIVYADISNIIIAIGKEDKSDNVHVCGLYFDNMGYDVLSNGTLSNDILSLKDFYYYKNNIELNPLFKETTNIINRLILSCDPKDLSKDCGLYITLGTFGHDPAISNFIERNKALLVEKYKQASWDLKFNESNEFHYVNITFLEEK